MAPAELVVLGVEHLEVLEEKLCHHRCPSLEGKASGNRASPSIASVVLAGSGAIPAHRLADGQHGGHEQAGQDLGAGDVGRPVHALLTAEVEGAEVSAGMVD